MRKMLKDDLIRVLLFTILSFLATAFVAIIDKDEKLSILTKAFIYIIPILNYLKNKENLKIYGVKLTIIKEFIILVCTLFACVFVEMFNAYVFTKSLIRVYRLVDFLILITEVLVLIDLLFINRIYRKVGFIFLLGITTVTFFLIASFHEYHFVIYVFYLIVDIILIFELYWLTRHDINK